MSPGRTSETVASTAPGRVPDSRPAPRRAVPLTVVPDAAPRRRRRAFARTCTALAVVMSAVGLFFVVFLHVLLTQGQADLDRLEARAEAEGAQNRRLRVAVAELESPARVVGVARQRLGMVPPAAVTYLQAVDPAAPLPPIPTGPAPRPAPSVAPPPTTPRSATSAGQSGPSTAPPRPATSPTTAGPRRSAPSTTAAPPPTTRTVGRTPGAGR